MSRLRAGWSGFRASFFLFGTTSIPTLRPSQPPVQWLPGTLCLELKWQGHETAHSPASCVEVKNAWSCNSTPPYIKHRENFALSLFSPSTYPVPSVSWTCIQCLEGRKRTLWLGMRVFWDTPLILQLKCHGVFRHSKKRQAECATPHAEWRGHTSCAYNWRTPLTSS
jgi:hypothetical protein